MRLCIFIREGDMGRPADAVLMQSASVITGKVCNRDAARRVAARC